MSALFRLLQACASLRLTLVCLGLAMIVIFVGTMAQVDHGIFFVQKHIFESFLVTYDVLPRWLPLPVIPGGALIAVTLGINLLAAIFFRFTWNAKKLGIWLVHGGILLLLGGGFVTAGLSIESQMVIDEGGTKNYSESTRFTELALTRAKNDAADEVISIPDTRYIQPGDIEDARLPVRLRIHEYHPNSQLRRREAGDPAGKATMGIGAQLAFTPAAPDPREETLNQVIVIAEVFDGNNSLGTWLLSNTLGAPQNFVAGGVSWQIAVRNTRYYNPYSIRLLDFQHEIHAGTDIPRHFASQIELQNPETGEQRKLTIYMNNPLRYHGKTYYQAAFANNDTTSILAVVENPGWTTPYLSCTIITLGLCVQFLSHLSAFTRRRRAAEAAA